MTNPVDRRKHLWFIRCVYLRVGHTWAVAVGTMGVPAVDGAEFRGTFIDSLRPADVALVPGPGSPQESFPDLDSGLGPALNTEPDDKARPDSIATARELGGDWRWIPWFGLFNTTHLPWIFHENHGWLYLGPGNLKTGQLLYDSTLGWTWVSNDAYPYIFSIERNKWLLYRLFTRQPRIFNELDTKETLTFHNARGVGGFNQFIYNEFDLTNSTININALISGGPPKDGIPAINNPRFLSIPEVTYMEDSDILVAVTSGGETRGYPFRILNWHEIVNDRVGDDAYVVTYCPLCGSAIVFHAYVNGRLRTFGVSGLLFQNNLLMYDQESQSLWSQFMLQALIGSMIKTRLNWRFSEQLTWGDFKARYPNGRLLSTDTGFVRDYALDPYATYFKTGRPKFPIKPIRDDLPAKEWVWGILVGDIAKAYPLNALPDAVPVLDTIAGVELELILNAAARSVRVTVVETGEPQDNGVGSFWFSWQDFYPNTEVF